MRRSGNALKLAVGAASVLLYLIAMVPTARPYPPFVSQAKRLGFPVKDCTYCHARPTGGQPLNQVGQWLVAERERRGAAAVEVKWLADYNAQPQGGGGGAATGRQTAAPRTNQAGGGAARG